MKRNSIDLVKEFHETFGHQISSSPTVPDEATNKFRSEFMEEESKETKKACDEGDLVELADGLGDIQYVLDGWFLNAGLHEKKDDIMAEIHRSNMTKLCKDEDEVRKTLDFYNTTTAEGVIADYRVAPNGIGFVIFRKSDGKILKSINYEKPNLKKIIYGE